MLGSFFGVDNQYAECEKRQQQQQQTPSVLPRRLSDVRARAETFLSAWRLVLSFLAYSLVKKRATFGPVCSLLAPPRKKRARISPCLFAREPCHKTSSRVVVSGKNLAARIVIFLAALDILHAMASFVASLDPKRDSNASLSGLRRRPVFVFKPTSAARSKGRGLGGVDRDSVLFAW